MTAKLEIRQRLTELRSDVETALEELDEADEQDQDEQDELLDTAAERDQLAAELDIARERIRQLESELEQARGRVRRARDLFDSMKDEQ